VLIDTVVVSLGMYLQRRQQQTSMCFFYLHFRLNEPKFFALIVVSGMTAFAYGVLLYNWGY